MWNVKKLANYSMMKWDRVEDGGLNVRRNGYE